MKQTIAEIQLRAEDVRKAAQRLTARIEQFEKFLGGMPGRVETSFNWQGGISVLFRRDGKDWRLYWKDNTNNEAEYRLAVDGPLKVKINVLQLAPDIVDAMAHSQQALHDMMNDAASQYDEMIADKLGMPRLP